MRRNCVPVLARSPLQFSRLDLRGGGELNVTEGCHRNASTPGDDDAEEPRGGGEDDDRYDGDDVDVASSRPCGRVLFRCIGCDRPPPAIVSRGGVRKTEASARALSSPGRFFFG